MTQRHMIVTLPTVGPFGPIRITAREDQDILICDHQGRPVGRVSEMGKSETFKITEPKWWQFWRGKRWERAHGERLQPSQLESGETK